MRYIWLHNTLGLNINYIHTSTCVRVCVCVCVCVCECVCVWVCVCFMTNSIILIFYNIYFLYYIFVAAKKLFYTYRVNKYRPFYCSHCFKLFLLLRLLFKRCTINTIGMSNFTNKQINVSWVISMFVLCLYTY